VLWQNVVHGCAGTIIGEEMHRSLIAKTASVSAFCIYIIRSLIVITEFLARALGKRRPLPQQIESESEVLMESSRIILLLHRVRKKKVPLDFLP